jgi:CRP-like cAMP-binding protein
MTPAVPTAAAAHDLPTREDAAWFQAHCATDRGADALLLPGWQVDDWAALLACGRVLRLATGEVLMRAGQAAAGGASAGPAAGGLYLLVAGGLEVRAGQRGALGQIQRERPGAVLGEVAFFDDGPRSATVWASVPSRLIAFDPAAVRAFAAAQPARGHALLLALGRVLARRVRRSEDRRQSDTL